MKKLLLAALIATPTMALSTGAYAEHMDVIENEFVNDCTLTELMPIVADFNEWGAEYNYNAKILMPLQSSNLGHLFWVGTSPDAASFGAAWDAWRDGQADPKSTPAKLQKRFSACTKNLARRSYDVF